MTSRPTSILCLGDGIHTDILGAMGENLDSLFVTGGLFAAEKPARSAKRSGSRAAARPI
jgi:ribonucleotide monophosphatase NagD (HAD superfamily)